MYAIKSFNVPSTHRVGWINEFPFSYDALVPIFKVRMRTDIKEQSFIGTVLTISKMKFLFKHFLVPLLSEPFISKMPNYSKVPTLDITNITKYNKLNITRWNKTGYFFICNSRQPTAQYLVSADSYKTPKRE